MNKFKKFLLTLLLTLSPITIIANEKNKIQYLWNESITFELIDSTYVKNPQNNTFLKINGTEIEEVKNISEASSFVQNNYLISVDLCGSEFMSLQYKDFYLYPNRGKFDLKKEPVFWSRSCGLKIDENEIWKNTNEKITFIDPTNLELNFPVTQTTE